MEELWLTICWVAYGRCSCAASSLSPRNQKTARDLHVSLFRLNSPSSVTIAQQEWPDHQGHITEDKVPLRLNIRFYPASSFPRMEVLGGGSAGRVRTAIYLLRGVLTCMLGDQLWAAWFA